MTAIVLPDIDRSTFEDLKERMPSLRLSEIELPSMEKAGRDADRAIDRLMGRSRPSAWTWIAAGIGITAVIGIAAAVMTWMRRPSWSSGIGSGYRSSSPSMGGGVGYGEATIVGTTETDITSGTDIAGTSYGGSGYGGTGYGSETTGGTGYGTGTTDGSETSIEGGQP
jgi:hypothetical protein